MAHNIARIDGVNAFVAVGNRKDVWHQLGQYVSEAMTAADCMRLAKLDFTAIKNQNYARNASGVVVPVDTYSIFRSDNDALLGAGVGEGYTIMQPVAAFNFVDALVEAPGGQHYDTAGALGKGERIFLSVRVPEADIEIVAGDKLESSLIFTTSFDGSGASTACLSTTRPVCQNTLRAAISTASGIVRVRHTSHQDVRFEQALRMMTGVKQDAATLRDKLQLIASRKMTRETMTAVMDRLFPVKAENVSQASTTRRENTIAEIMALYESNDNNAVPEIRGSGWNLLNAFTEYADFHKMPKLTAAREGYTVARARAENAAFGTGDALKQDALTAILELTAGAPAMAAAAGR